MIAVIDYGINNTGSVIRMIEKVGGEALRVSNPEQLENVNKLILPGVGHFGEGMRQLKSLGFVNPLREMIIEDKIPMLGICLGMQLLCESSEEGDLPGLGLVHAKVRHLRCEGRRDLKIPHMGWNTLEVLKKNALIDGDSGPLRFYFVHSYHVIPEDHDLCIAEANYGESFCAAFQYGLIYGVQFHPEKSHRFGMSLMKRFVEL